MKSSCNVRDQHSASANNKRFVKLHEKISQDFTHSEIAEGTGIACSTYCKIKLGYYPAYDYRIKALRDLVVSLYGPEYGV